MLYSAGPYSLYYKPLKVVKLHSLTFPPSLIFAGKVVAYPSGATFRTRPYWVEVTNNDKRSSLLTEFTHKSLGLPLEYLDLQYLKQGTQTKREGSVQLTSLHYLV